MTLSVIETVGLAQQASLGTPTDPVTHLFPVSSFQISEEFEAIVDNGRRGRESMDYNSIQGVKKVNITIEGIVQANGTTGMAIGLLLRNLLGTCSSYTVTQIGATGVYKHWRKLSNTKEYLTVEHDSGLTGTNVRQIEGCRCKELTFSWNAAEGQLLYTAALTGRDVTLVTSTDLSAQIATLEDGFAGWRAVVNVNGSAGFSRLISTEWSLTRAEKLIYSGENTQLYNDILLGAFEVTASMVFNYINSTDINLFRDKTQGELTHLFEFGTSGTLRGFGISGLVMDFGDGVADIDSSGDNLTLALSGRSLHSESNGALGVDLDARDSSSDAASQNGPVETVTEEQATSAY